MNIIAEDSKFLLYEELAALKNNEEIKIEANINFVKLIDEKIVIKTNINVLQMQIIARFRVIGKKY